VGDSVVIGLALVPAVVARRRCVAFVFRRLPALGDVDGGRFGRYRLLLLSG
jgi:hypothetical protein